MDYTLLNEQMEALAQAEGWYVSLFANASALLWETLPDINWAGFYTVDGPSLLLGPFHGKIACIRIPREKGVCGAALRENRTVLVPDVHACCNHSACDLASASEVVLIIRVKGNPYALLDIDSPVKNRFGPEEQAGLEALARTIEEQVLWK